MVAVICFAVGLTSGIASANHFFAGYESTSRTATVTTLLYYNLTAVYTTAQDDNRTNNLEPTDLNTFLASTHSQADVSVNDSLDGSSAALALEQCITPSTVFPDRCNHAHVHHNLSITLSSAQKKSVACHELGHSIGFQEQLFDAGSSCMRTNYPVDNTGFDDHDKEEINGRY